MSTSVSKLKYKVVINRNGRLYASTGATFNNITLNVEHRAD